MPHNENLSRLYFRSLKVVGDYGDSETVFDYELYTKMLLRDVISIVRWYPEVHTQGEQDVLEQAIRKISEHYGVVDNGED